MIYKKQLQQKSVRPSVMRFFAGGFLLDLSQVIIFSCWAASDWEFVFHSVFGYEKFIVPSVNATSSTVNELHVASFF